MNHIRILAFSGSTRQASLNTLLCKVALSGAAKLGATTTWLDLRDLALPMYDEDLETKSGLPEGARRLKDLMESHHGFLIASPEYNGSLSAALKNAIDWASRPEPGKAPLSCFQDKVAGLFAASPGALGGLRGLAHVRQILGNINVIVLPQQMALMRAHEAFDANGQLKDAKQQQMATDIGALVAKTCGKLSG